MSRWNHNICEPCWIQREGKWEPAPEFGEGAEKLVGVRLPHRLKIGEGQFAEFIGYPGTGVEPCCFCGNPSISGIVIRADPVGTVFHSSHKHDDA